MKAECIITNCRRPAPAGEAFCTRHRDKPKPPETPSPDAEALADALEEIADNQFRSNFTKNELENYARAALANYRRNRDV